MNNEEMNRFLGTATGPSTLAAELRVKTQPLMEYFQRFNTIHSLQTTFPESALGGELVPLMSDRFQQWLNDSNQSEEIETWESSGHTVFPDYQGVEPGPAAGEDQLPVSAGSEKSSTRALIFPESTADVQGDGLGTISLPGETKDKDSLWSQFQRAVRQYRLSASPLQKNSQAGLGGKPLAIESIETTASASPSMLAQKINEYFRVNITPGEQLAPGHQDQQNTRKANEGPEHFDKSPSLFDLPSDSSGSSWEWTSWPKMTETQLARELHAFTKGRDDESTAKSTVQPVSPGDPENARTPNTFTIRDGNDGTGNREYLRDLTENIAHILREQALHQGIDIT
ncbi:MAG: hypothetical protein PVH61_25685 [Candidatus Aminicenantes bacterium]|jgi:hypothetical protein